MFARLSLAAALVASSSTFAAPIAWTDWTSASATAGTAQGSIAAASGVVNVSYSGGYSFVDTGCGNTNPWWTVGNYNGPVNKPLDCDIVALNAGGLKTIAFDSAVLDPYIALMSWNSNVVTFSEVFTVVGNGTGWWGSGTPVVSGDSKGFTGNGEVHAILQFKGTFNSISFTDRSENWHGFTVGVADRASAVPEPTSLALVLPALGVALAAARRRRGASAA